MFVSTSTSNLICVWGGRVETRLNLLVRFPQSLRNEVYRASEKPGKAQGSHQSRVPIAGWWVAVAVVWCVQYVLTFN
jgi:hypothetical protein